MTAEEFLVVLDNELDDYDDVLILNHLTVDDGYLLRYTLETCNGYPHKHRKRFEIHSSSLDTLSLDEARSYASYSISCVHDERNCKRKSKMSVKRPTCMFTDDIYGLLASPVKYTPEIEKVIFNKPATIVIWKDGTKTIVKCQKGDKYDKEKGLAMCIAKKTYGNNGNYCEIFKEWI